MLTRRTLLQLTGAASMLALLGPALAAPALAQSAQQATAFVKSTGDALVAVVNGSGSPSDKRHQLQQVIDSTVDVDEIARFCLGRFWRQATPDQQRQYIGLFHEVLLNNIAAKLGEYQGVRFVMGRAQEREDTDVVNTTVERPNNPPTQVDWIVSTATGQPKIIDVVAEGTSLRLTQRSDYASYLSRNGNNVKALIDAMQKQAAQSG
ncbi:MAG TPA: ABC transporter substrate-binding protein [Acetobacteraceae bacterium]|nr:ABC transporter substrate-binding protein [Acetobacteraceae bacterium]